MPVIVVESVGKQRGLSQLVRKAGLGGDWAVISCNGHYCGLPKTKIGIDRGTFELVWKVRNKQALDQVRKAANTTDIVYAATDLSPEGEALADQIRITAEFSKKEFFRLAIPVLDVDGLTSALASPSSINEGLLQGY